MGRTRRQVLHRGAHALPSLAYVTAAMVLLAAVPKPAAAQAGTPPAVGDERVARLAPVVDSIFADMNRADGPGAAVAVLQDGRIVLERGYGRAQLEYDAPITPATVFHVASVSKQFTAFAIALLARDGRLSLDDDIRTHLPELHDFGRRITIRHLIHHTSGIRDQWELAMMAGWRLDDVITRDQIMALMRRQRELNFEPGAEHLYSNMGYTLLAEIVERASGQPFGEYLRQTVFEPLGMLSTHVHNDHERVVPNRAYSYRPGAGGAGWRNAVLSYANQGATSLFTTAGDLARWLRNLETAQVGGPDVVAQMFERGVLRSGDTLDYAFAIVRSEYSGRPVWGHGGADAGFRSITVHFRDDGLGIVVLSNAANADPARHALAVADAFLGRPPAAAASAARQPEQRQPVQPQQPAWRPESEHLRQYAGDYYSPELGVVYAVDLREQGLVLTHHRLSDAGLAPQVEDVFRFGSRMLRFERGADGIVTGFRISGSRVRNLAFIRLPDGSLPPLRPQGRTR
jgi:CubicO group peptidase (beta-lactamase class C family)